MELHFIILIALSAILLLFIILAICAYCCCDLCCSCGNSSYSHSRESYHHETSTKTSAKGEYNSNNGQLLPSLMSSPQPIQMDEDHSTPLLRKDPPPLGFGYPIDTEEVGEKPYSNGGFYPPGETVATISYPASHTTPLLRDPDITDTSHHVETISYARYPPTTQSNSAVVEVNGVPHSVAIDSHQFASAAPLPNKNTPYSSTRISETTALERTPYQPDPVKTETMHHVQTVSYGSYPPSKQTHLSDMEAGAMPHPVVTNTHRPSLPTKNTSHSETEFSKTVVKPSSQRMPYQQNPESIETSYHVETGSYAPRSSSKHIYSYDTEPNEILHPVAYSYRYAPTKNTSYSGDSQSTETEYLTRSGSCPPSNITPYESTTRNFYPLELHRNKTHSARTVTYSSEDIAPYPMSIKVANSVELLPSLDSEASYDQTHIGKSRIKKQPSQVSLYDNM